MSKKNIAKKRCQVNKWPANDASYNPDFFFSKIQMVLEINAAAVHQSMQSKTPKKI